MSWVKVDDDMASHPKLLALDRDLLAGFGLWMIGSCYAGRYLTDGYVPGAALPAGSSRVAKRLVEIGLWEDVPGGFRIHDYLDYQPSREKVLAQRAERAAAGHAGGLASGKQRASKEASNGEARGSADAARSVEPMSKQKRTPARTPTREPLPVPTARPRGGRTDFDSVMETT